MMHCKKTVLRGGGLTVAVRTEIHTERFMKEIRANQSQSDTAPATGVARAAYSRPVLHVYGSISQLTMGFGGSSVDTIMNSNKMLFGGGAPTKPSDRATKENIMRIGQHPLGIGLYLFDYKPAFRDAHGHGRQLGVMADEVEQVLPAAVCVHPDGYKMVDYGMLAQASRAIH
jgi:hypothetical protein